MKRKSILLLLLTLMSASLCACTDKGDEEKALYRDNLQKYYDEIYMTSVSINSVDFNSPNAANDFLFYFDTLNASFVNLAAIETPAKYEPFCELTSQASSYISQADTIYHEIYSGENFENFDLEICLNNAEEITAPCDYLFICLYLKEKNVDFTSYSPKLFGEFYPECDYIGNIKDITKQLSVFESISSKYGEHKISIHNSNKFSLYKIINEITNGYYHIKTSNTNWLRVPLVASIHNKELFNKMLKIAINNQKIQIPIYEHPEIFIKNKEYCMLFTQSYNIILNELESEINDFLSEYETEYYYLIGKNIEAHLQ